MTIDPASAVSFSDRLTSLLQTLDLDPSLLLPHSLRERLLAIDELDVLLGGISSPLSGHADLAQIGSRALALLSRLESANAKLYQSIRAEIISGEARTILPWLEDLAPDERTTGLRPGLGFDARDDFMASIFQHSDPGERSSPRSREMVAYQPTPVRHILHFLENVELSPDDHFVDLGSGLGQAPLLVSMLSGVQSLGIEIEPAYVANAEACAAALQLGNVSFVAADGRDADLSTGTIFYLYSPFTGSILKQVLAKLRKQSQARPIQLCSLGPCTRDLAKEEWLKARGPLDPNRITRFESLPDAARS
jgi:hypothetical protein